MTTTNHCMHCGKYYTRINSYKKHIILCEIAHKSKRLRICEDEETTDIPSITTLYNIIQEMAIKQQKMEEKMEEMQKWIDKKKKKLDVVKWLNTQFTLPLNYEDRIKSFIIIEDDITLLIEQNFPQTIINILKRNLITNTESIKEPIACFAEKSNVFYIYKTTTTETTTETTIEKTNQWIKMSTDDFVYLLKIIHFKLLNGLCSWRDKNSEKMKQSDKISELYNKSVIKLMGADFTQESFLSKIRAPLYGYLKGDFKNMIEYEFEF